MNICISCKKLFSGIDPEKHVCRECLIKSIKEEELAGLPKHESPKIESLGWKNAWLLPDKKANH